MNEDVLKMIDTLHARLDDVRDAVLELPCEASEYVGKLDKIDDKVYLLELEIEKLAKAELAKNPNAKKTKDTLSESQAAAKVDSTESAVQAESTQSDVTVKSHASATAQADESAGSDGAATTDTFDEEPVQVKKVVSAEDADGEVASSSEEDDQESEKKSEGKSRVKEIFTDDMKDNLADAGRAIGNIYRDGKEVVSELTGTMGELKDAFSFGKKRR